MARAKTTNSNNSTCNNSNNKRKLDIAADLICPITLELPIDPVTAKDGRVYERHAIEEHMAVSQRAYLGQGVLRSPITNNPMGSAQLLPSPQIKNLIGTLIANGTITGELADSWKEKEEDQKQANLLLQEARDHGDADAMYEIYRRCKSGSDPFFRQDFDVAYHWLQRAHRAGSVKATAVWGMILCTGQMGDDEEFIPHNKVTGMVLTTLAAQQGSDLAAFRLGRAYALGMYGMMVDVPEAIGWLEVSLSMKCRHSHISEAIREQARELLVYLMDAVFEDDEDGEHSHDDISSSEAGESLFDQESDYEIYEEDL